jgi:hypothetical protein
MTGAHHFLDVNVIHDPLLTRLWSPPSRQRRSL